ncbi:hypothetical protein GGI25_004074 [Coemansia spiralis]|uniref:Uncharacterized protein n=2 Tax=Coemansia TaxID=4863 RepID=A0A9W8G6V8_9FUNG|nr:GPI biosynthesis protein family Pig-F-domain-containing protein [Coemansia spiralis]KAJ1991659.1 hypothetical protein EDC05_003284 [Coemansia umbellata]KAJ2620839.1 hypothetical protein GGI26_004634 [Coemansia sp. RSA 1358]KAJ2675234.1 hypothetical protein GGI25_004074 [Coemansia spiralis]
MGSAKQHQQQDKPPASSGGRADGAALADHKKYPLEANGIELMLAGMANAMSLVTPRKGLNIYANPVKYLSVTASVLFGYYAILTFADIYCFKVTDARRRSKPLAARVRSVLGMALATLVAAAVIALGFVLFGAPVGSQHAETLMAALNVALLAVTPVILTLKRDIGSWRRALLSVEAKSIPEKWAAGFFWCTMTTTWAAAYFVPMDWGRPWQRWPIPIVGGAFLGNLISLLFVALRCFVLPMARADFQESERIKVQMTREPHPGSAHPNAVKKDQ